MRRFAFIAPLAAVMAVAATPAQAQPEIIVTLGPKVQADAERLGEREVARQASRLAQVVGAALRRPGAVGRPPTGDPMSRWRTASCAPSDWVKAGRPV